MSTTKKVAAGAAIAGVAIPAAVGVAKKVLGGDEQPKRRSVAKRKTAAKRTPAKRKTAAKRTTAKRKTTAKRSPAKRATAKKRK